jgi:hypothetical protein
MTDRRPRNNIASLDYEPREMVCDWLADGKPYGYIRERLSVILKGTEFENRKFHNTTFNAYMNGKEYEKYLADRSKFSEKIKDKRRIASFINSGRGIESASDVAAMELLEQIENLSGSGLEVKDIQKLAASVVALKRSTVSAKEKALQSELEKEKAQHKAYVEELTKKIAALEEKRSISSAGLSEEALKKIKEQARIM